MGVRVDPRTAPVADRPPNLEPDRAAEAAELRASLADRVVLVTGGSMGIGLACAEAALNAGARVLIAARGAEALDSALDRLAGLAVARGRTAAPSVFAVAADVSLEADVAGLVQEAVSRFGRLDGLVHAAGVLGPVGPSLDADPAEWWDAVRVNLLGTFLVVRAAGRVMSRSGGGRMVLLSGGGATRAFPNYSAYAASKAAVVRLAETLAAELAPHGVELNALAPGFVATRIHEATLAAGERAGEDYLRYTRRELERGGVPAALAAGAAVFLLSDRARGITGRLVAAPWDAWWRWPERVAELEDGDLFTLRRITPADRGLEWR